MRKLKILFAFLSLVASCEPVLTFAQAPGIKPHELPQTSTGTGGDWIIKEDSAYNIPGNGVEKITVRDFMALYGIGDSVGSVPSGAAGGDLSGTYPNPNVRRSSVAFSLDSAITPAALSGQQDNWNPTGLAGATVIRASSTLDVAITGIVGGYKGRILIFLNIGTNSFLLANSTTSTAQNQFKLSGDIILSPSQGAILWYDITSLRWRCAALVSSAASLVGVSATRPLVSSGGTSPILSTHFASATDSGAVHTSDWLKWTAKCDSVKRKSGTDSVFCHRNGTAYFQYRDSVGITGTGFPIRLAFWKNTTNLSNHEYLNYDTLFSKLAIGSTTPRATLHAMNQYPDSVSDVFLVEDASANDLFKVNKVGKISTNNSVTGDWINMLSATTSEIYIKMKNDGGRLYLGVDNSAGNGLFANGLPYATVIGTAIDGTALQFGTNNINRLTFLNSGYAGFGTNAPRGLLHLKPVLSSDTIFIVNDSAGRGVFKILNDSIYMFNLSYTGDSTLTIDINGRVHKGAPTGGGGGSVSNVSTTDGYGINSSVSNPTTTPDITITFDSAEVHTKFWDKRDTLAILATLYDLSDTSQTNSVNMISGGTGVLATKTGKSSYSIVGDTSTANGVNRITATSPLTATTTGHGSRNISIAPDTSAIEVMFGGGTTVVDTGVTVYIEVPFSCTILRATILADVSTTTTVQIWKDLYANYPPVLADKIYNATPPSTSAAIKNQDTTLSGWTTSITSGDILAFHLSANDLAKSITVSLKVVKTQ